MSKNEYTQATVKYLTNVRKYLKDKYGKVSPEWEQSLTLLADNIELYEKCKESIEKDGLMLVAKNGSMTKSPLIKVMFDAEIQISKILAEFGLTPRSASKLTTTNEDNDELIELMGD